MKPVIYTTTDKNGAETTEFHPSARMIVFAGLKAKNPEMSDPDIARLGGMDPSLPNKWATKYGRMYLEWLEEMIDQAVGENQAAALEAVGLVNALQGNFQFWREMARSKGVIKDEVKEQKITINTDFSAILLGGDFESARRKILETYRGVGHQGSPGVADSSRVGLEGSSQSQGNRTIEVQGRQVALDHPLGEDGGSSEQGVPVPAISQQDPPPGANPRLGSRKKPARSKN